jgi:hypothetical protein
MKNRSILLVAVDPLRAALTLIGGSGDAATGPIRTTTFALRIRRLPH